MSSRVWDSKVKLRSPAEAVLGFHRGRGANPRGGGAGANIRFCQIVPITAWNRMNLDPRRGASLVRHLYPLMNVNSGASRISQTGAPTPRSRDANLLFAKTFVENCMNIHWRIQGGVRDTPTPLRIQILSFSCSVQKTNSQNKNAFQLVDRMPESASGGGCT